MKTKTILFVGGGLAIATAAFFLLKGGNKKLTALEKMTLDAHDPNTKFGHEIMAYNTQTGAGYNETTIQSAINYHIQNNTPIAMAYAAKNNWDASEVVTY